MKTRQIVGVILLIALIVGAVFFYRAVEEGPVCETVAELRIAGELEAAKKAARQCLEEDPDHGDARVELSRILAMQGDYETALDWLHSAVEVTGERPGEYLLWNARLLYWMEDYEGAEQIMARIDVDDVDGEEYAELKAALDRARAQCDEARKHRRAGRLETGLEVAAECVADFPDELDSKLEIARILSLQGEPRIGLQWLMSTLLAMGDDATAEAYLLKAQLLYRLGEHERAILVLDRLSPEEVDPREYRELREALGRALAPCDALGKYRLAGDLDLARQMALECLTANPGHADAWLELSRILAMEGRYNEALAWAQSAIGADGDNLEYRMWKARLLYWMGRIEEAQAVLDALKGEDSIGDEVDELQAALDRVNSICNAVQRLRRAGEVEAAIEAALECLEEKPNHVVAQAELSRLLGQQGHYAPAIRWIKSAIAADGGNPDYELWKARLWYWMGDFERAQQVLEGIDGDAVDGEELRKLEEAIARAIDAAPMVCATVSRFRLRGETQRAMTAAFECLRQDPDHGEVRIEISRLLAMRGDHATAMKWVEEALERDDDHRAEILFWKARLRYWEGDHQRAFVLLEKVDIEEVDPRRVASLHDIVLTDQILSDAQPPKACRDAESYRVDGDLHAAYEAAQRCLQEAPDLVEAKVEMSRVLGMLGHYEAALERIDEALAMEGAKEEHQLWKARLLLWMGEGKEAKALLKSIDPDEVGRSEWEGLAWAVHDALEAEEHLAARRRPYYLGEMAMLRGRDGEGGWRSRHGLAGYPTDDLYGEVLFDITRRRWVNDQSMDTALRGHGRYELNDRFRLEAGGSVAPGADFSPLWSSYVDPGVMFGPELDVGLRLQRIKFPDQPGVHVIRPAMLWGFGSFFVDGRFYYAFEPNSRNARSIKARLLYWPSDALQIFAGGAVGNKADYLEGYDTPERAYEAVTGLQLELTSMLDVLGDFRYRWETVDGQTYRLIRTTGGVRIRF